MRVAKMKFWYKIHRWPNFEHPRDVNEKINWMKFYGDTSLWPVLADKYAVRDYVKQCGLASILNDLYAKWDRVEDMDFSALPDQFVIKANNSCATVIIVRDKEKLKIEETKRVELSNILNTFSKNDASTSRSANFF